MRTAIAVACLTAAAAAEISNPFEETSGDNSYANGWGDFNWIEGRFNDISPHSGKEHFLSAVGNDFPDLTLRKELGGIVEDNTYDVSFWIGMYADQLPVELADFDRLVIGQEEGEMIWDATPVPNISGQYVQWTGTFTPAVDDLGKPFLFIAVLDFPAGHSVAFDGDVNVTITGACPADLDNDGDADADDFFAYLDAFAAGELAICDLDEDGDCDADDFFAYLDFFAFGC